MRLRQSPLQGSGMSLALSVMLICLALSNSTSAQEPKSIELTLETWYPVLGILPIRAEGTVTLKEGEGRYSINATVDGLFYSGNALVDGRSTEAGVRPEIFDQTWSRPFATRHAVLRYDQDGPVQPTVAPLPANIDEAKPEQRRYTIDELTAYYSLTRLLAEKGTCKLFNRIFDGVRLFDLQFLDNEPPKELLPENSDHHFAGETRVCRVSGYDIAGFPKGAQPAPESHTGIIWLAWFSPCSVIIPVKLHLDNKIDDKPQPTDIYTPQVSGCGSIVRF
jgi:hypothetical protein